MRDLNAARVTVMGLGRFGGGVGVVRWLAARGASILITDLDPQEELRNSLDAIADLSPATPIRFHLGGHREEDFRNADLIVANPAVPRPWSNPYLNAARETNVPVTTEIRLLTERIDRDRVIGVTGSAGKSTTAAMTHHLLSRAGFRAHLGGNLGGSLLGALDLIQPDDWIVLELSSFMLHWLGEDVGFSGASGWSPHVSAITNIEPNHLDWHESFEHYRASKENIARWQTLGDHLITADDLPRHPEPVELAIPGRHNQANAWMAMLIAQRAVELDPKRATPLFADFRGLPHRLELVTEVDDQRFYNDSKSTTPAATALAVQAFPDPARVHLIAGGYDKGSDLSSIAQLARTLGGLYAIGATGRAIANNVDTDRAVYCETLEHAVTHALTRMKPGDVLLLSPGCASWDQFTHFEERGERFAQLVREHLAAAGSS